MGILEFGICFLEFIKDSPLEVFSTFGNYTMNEKN